MLLLISFIIQYLQPTACVYWQLGLKRHQCLSIIWIPIGICHRVSDIEELWELGGWQSCTAKAPDALHLPLDVGILDLVWVKLLRLLAEFFFQLAEGLRCLLGDAPAEVPSSTIATSVIFICTIPNICKNVRQLWKYSILILFVHSY